MKIYLACPFCGSDDLEDVPDPRKDLKEIPQQMGNWPHGYLCKKCTHQFTSDQAAGMVKKEQGKTYRIA